ncbi:MAG: cupredoxin domain-containing protein [Rickettsiales bacterium]|nr:MAG: cupredoxin domain-containing protein [Rickettsiales bacterium]
MKNLSILFVSIIILLFSSTSYAKDEIEVNIYIKDHKFYPDQLELPSGHKIRITIYNQDSTIEEFESPDLKREKIIPGLSKATIILAPLKVGVYKFYGEFNEDTAKGSIIIKDSLEEAENV